MILILGRRHTQASGVFKMWMLMMPLRVRQPKRWTTDKWGMFRNIPESELRKMVRVRRWRFKMLGRRTKFLRRHGAGEFQDVSSARLDAYEKRAGTRLDSPTSDSSESSS